MMSITTIRLRLMKQLLGLVKPIINYTLNQSTKRINLLLRMEHLQKTGRMQELADLIESEKREAKKQRISLTRHRDNIVRLVDKAKG